MLTPCHGASYLISFLCEMHNHPCHERGGVGVPLSPTACRAPRPRMRRVTRKSVRAKAGTLWRLSGTQPPRFQLLAHSLAKSPGWRSDLFDLCVAATYTGKVFPSPPTPLRSTPYTLAYARRSIVTARELALPAHPRKIYGEENITS